MAVGGPHLLGALAPCAHTPPEQGPEVSWGFCWLASVWDRSAPHAPAPGVPVWGGWHPRVLLEPWKWQWPLFVTGPEEGKYCKGVSPPQHYSAALAAGGACLDRPVPPGSSGQGQQAQAQEEALMPLPLLPVHHPEPAEV